MMPMRIQVGSRQMTDMMAAFKVLCKRFRKNPRWSSLIVKLRRSSLMGSRVGWGRYSYYSRKFTGLFSVNVAYNPRTMLPLVTELTIQVAQVVPRTDAEGPGSRFALWFQGCPLRCPGCCNPEYLPFKGGQTMTLSEMTEWISRTEGIEGMTLLGGEPFAHLEAATALAEFAQQRGLTVMIFSGYTRVDLQTNPANANLLAATDILVDGPYLREQPDTSRRWIGSTNQRIHFLTDRYRADDPCWKQKNTLEIRVEKTGVTVNGFPAAHAVGLWKGWTRKKRTN
jgi:anaerobic ribonucleoside-triphosphate reductase activating protein